MFKMWKQLVEQKYLLNEASETEYDVEGGLLNISMPSTESAEIMLAIKDAQDVPIEQKNRAIKLLTKILKLLEAKGYFGDVQEFLGSAAVRRKLVNFGIVQAQLAQPLAPKELKGLLRSSGLKVELATEEGEEEERPVEPELQREPQDDNEPPERNVTLARDLEKKKQKNNNKDREKEEPKEEGLHEARGGRLALIKSRAQRLRKLKDIHDELDFANNKLMIVLGSLEDYDKGQREADMPELISTLNEVLDSTEAVQKIVEEHI